MQLKSAVLDNEERDVLREEEADAAEAANSDDDYTDEDTEEEDPDFDEYKEYIPQSVMMGYIKTLSEYGYSDFYKLQKLPAQDWDDLKHNVRRSGPNPTPAHVR